MSGLIWGGALNGLGQAGAVIGRDMALQEDKQANLALAAEERRQRARENQDAITERQREMAILKAELKKDGGGDGGGGGDWRTPGTAAHTDAALRLGVSEQQLGSLIGSIKSGDRSFLDQVAEGRGPMEDGSAMPEARVRPDGADKWYDAKMKTLSAISREYLHGKNLKNVADGEATIQNTGIIGKVLDGSMPAPNAAEAVAAGKGDGAYGKGNVNQFTGAPDAIGKSAISENNAQASNAANSGKRQLAEIDKINDEIKNGTGSKTGAQDRLTTIVNSQNATLRDLALNRPGTRATPEERAAHEKAVATATEIRDKANGQLQANLDARGAAPAQKATPAGSGKVSKSPPIANNGVTAGGSRWTLVGK